MSNLSGVVFVIISGLLLFATLNINGLMLIPFAVSFEVALKVMGALIFVCWVLYVKYQNDYEEVVWLYPIILLSFYWSIVPLLNYTAQVAGDAAQYHLAVKFWGMITFHVAVSATIIVISYPLVFLLRKVE
ncbi:hypothetical protein FJQ87_18555 (plasmid) [Shewanella sp. SNU WT4]|uniref:hypothetical protein n=1 Tax=Shewanella sp. SNU WT4 TaxID=2590015 RepID=UPI00112C521E|nr:hypothetical protein [Shewanella sp. SNU WT4]QDF68706.1 hypothetical protein FJQ87_18555 [Shewanella sp. SNU WT4]